MASDERSIIKQFYKAIKSNDPFKLDSAFESIYYYYYCYLFKISMDIIEDEETAKEVINDVFLSLFNNKDKLKEEKNIKYYLVTMTKNRSIDRLRQRKEICVDIDTFENSNKITLFNKITEFVDEQEYEIIVMHLVFNNTFIEIAKKKDLSSKKVRMIYNRAINKIKIGFGKR